MIDWPQWIAYCASDETSAEVAAETRDEVPDECPTCGGVLVVYKLVDRPSTYDGVVE